MLPNCNFVYNINIICFNNKFNYIIFIKSYNISIKYRLLINFHINQLIDILSI